MGDNTAIILKWLEKSEQAARKMGHNDRASLHKDAALEIKSLRSQLTSRDAEIERLQREISESVDRANKYMNDSIRQQERLGVLALKHGIANV